MRPKFKQANPEYITKGEHDVPIRPSIPAITPRPGYEWKEDWEMSDDFGRRWSGNIWLHRNRWEKTNSNWLGRPPSFFKHSNVSVRNGVLRLLSREDVAPKKLRPKYGKFSTAFVGTKKARRYGYFEIMCHMMDSSISSAFWFANNQDDMWTELDVFEYSTSKKQSFHGVPYEQLFNTNMHVHRHSDPAITRKSKPRAFNVDFNLSDNPVIVGFNWQEDIIEWYINGVLIRREPNLYFHQPLYLQLDSETFPNWFGLPSGEELNNLPNKFEIFYVRSWYQKIIKL